MRDQLERLSLNVLGAGLIVLIDAIVLQVVCSALDLNPIATFEQGYLLVGDIISLNSLLDSQWHLLVITGLLPAGLVWLMDRHVRVDFFYNKRTERAQARINLAGAVLFAAPFFALVLPASFGFVARAWAWPNAHFGRHSAHWADQQRGWAFRCLSFVCCLRRPPGSSALLWFYWRSSRCRSCKRLDLRNPRPQDLLPHREHSQS